MNLFVEMGTLIPKTSGLLIKLPYLGHVMRAHSVPESAAASWPASSSKRNTKDTIDHAVEYCFSATHACDHACSFNEKYHSVKEASHINPYWEEIWDLICSHLMVRCHQFHVLEDRLISILAFWHSAERGLLLVGCVCVCVSITLALWFWNQTCTTRTLRPVSAAKVSLTLDHNSERGRKNKKARSWWSTL